jgi:hypothetical protein
MTLTWLFYAIVFNMAVMSFSMFLEQNRKDKEQDRRDEAEWRRIREHDEWLAKYHPDYVNRRPD